MDLEIDRETWARGGHLGGPALLNAKGNMCCLGFAGYDLGVPVHDLGEAGEFADLPNNLIDFLGDLVFNPFCNIEEDPHDGRPMIVNTEFHDAAVELNDFKVIEINGTGPSAHCGEPGYMANEDDRERLLIALFEENGVHLTFVGEKLDEQTSAA